MNLMKSQIIRIRNLNLEEGRPAAVHVKPTVQLVLGCFLGIAMVLTGKAVPAWSGIFVFMVCLFSALFLPDRNLVRFENSYMILYNQRDRDLCMIVYYDEVVDWMYEYHNPYDKLILELTDGSAQSIEMYSRASILHFMKHYLPDKEKKNPRRKERKA